MDQKLSDPPKTPAEEREQKGPTPSVAVFLAAALIIAFIMFFLPVLDTP